MLPGWAGNPVAAHRHQPPRCGCELLACSAGPRASTKDRSVENKRRRRGAGSACGGRHPDGTVRIGGTGMSDGGRLAVPETAARMAGAASAFLAALAAEQRERACRDFGDERRDWSFLPERNRAGLPIGALRDRQRRLAHELIMAGTSLPGYAKVVSVMAMEHVLRALAPAAADLFDPERYCLRVFGTPGDQVWGWQLAGHHVSLNFTIVGGRYVSPTPSL